MLVSTLLGSLNVPPLQAGEPLPEVALCGVYWMSWQSEICSIQAGLCNVPEDDSSST